MQFNFKADERILSLMTTFREMINEAIRIGLTAKPRSRYQLRNLVYYDFKRRYGLHSQYTYNACEVAFSIIRKYRKWGRRPYAKRLTLKIQSESYWLKHMLLRIPATPHEYLFVQLHVGEYQFAMLDDPMLKRGSLLITPDRVIVTVSKQAQEMKSYGSVAYDINLRNVTGISTVSPEPVIHDTSRALQIRAQYRKVVSGFKRSDDRIRRKISSKYGTKERNKIGLDLHRISRQVVVHAKENKLSIVLENLRHIRRHHTKRAGETRRTRRKLNYWPFRLLQNMIQYKAMWEGVPVKYINPSGSSKRCSVCRNMNYQLALEKVWRCPKCGATVNRDTNAAINLLEKSLDGNEALGFGVDWLADEAVKREVLSRTSVESMPVSRRRPAES